MIFFKTQEDFVTYVQDLTQVDTYLFEGKKATSEIILIDIVDESNIYADNKVVDYWHTVEITFSTVYKSNKMKINKIMKNAFNCMSYFRYDTANDRVEVTYKTDVKIGEW